MKNIAIFPGSFDPFTYAHEYVVKQASQLYDKVIILVSDNAQKKCMFTAKERVTMIEQFIEYNLLARRGVTVDMWDGLLTDFAADFLNIYDNVHIIRGLRADNGAEEFNLATTYYEDFGVANCHSTLQTIMIPVLDKDKMNISSSRVREYIRRGKMNYVMHYCPPPIYHYIRVREYIRRNEMNYVLHYCPSPICHHIKDHQENSK